jgi:DNA-binding helix-hairpin-helix protein with protein kinase domain
MTVHAAPSTLRDAGGTPWHLGQQIGAGGEGTVYLVDDDPALVAKIYAEPPGAEQVAKLDAMIAAGDESVRRVAAWPSAVLYGDDGAVGFLMPKLASQLPLHELFGPRRRQELFPDAHWTFLVHAALNVARAFEAMHDRDIVVGDVNSNNVVIHRNAKTRFIDCDSFQIRRNGQLFRCTVGVPEYQPPELQAADLGDAERLPQHDRFGLAVMVFQLLFVGKHPFAGILPPHLMGDATIGANVAARHFFYGPDAAAAGLRPPPGSLALTALPDAIEALFHRAFLGEPAGRPTATEWREALRALESTTVACERSRRHRYVRDVACPWCALERTGLFYFAPRPEQAPPVDDTAWERFSDADVERVWREIAAVPPPPPLRDPVDPRPRRAASVLGLLAMPLAALALARRPELRAMQHERRSQLAALQTAFRARTARFRALAAGTPFADEVARLAAVRDAVLAQRVDRTRELALAHNAQYQRDAATFLAQFPIPRVPQVPGSLVTPSGPTTGIENRQMRELAMYGITNAAHVTVPNLRAVPHLRSWRFDVLMEWRRALDAQFAARPVRELDYTVRRTIEVRYARARDQARAELLAGAQRLRRLAADLTAEGDELTAALPGEAAALWRAYDEANVSPLFYGKNP